MDLINEYGPLGSTIFDCILCMIYREGYYLELTIDKLCLAVVKSIGSKWVKKHQVMQVIQYCADIGLFDKSLLARSVVTSAGIQRRYAEVTSRNKVDKSLYWLIDDDGQLLKTVPQNVISDTEKRISATEIPISTAEMQQDTEVRKKNKRESHRAACAAAPSLAEVKAYCEGKKVDPERFWNYYSAQGWKTSAGQPVRNWKALIANWEKTECPKADPEPPHTPSYDLEEYEKYDIFAAAKAKGEV